MAIGYATKWVIENWDSIADAVLGPKDCARCRVYVEEVDTNDNARYDGFKSQQAAAENRNHQQAIENNKNYVAEPELSVDQGYEQAVKNVQDSAGKTTELRPFGKELPKSNFIEKRIIEPNTDPILKNLLDGQQGRQQFEDYHNYQNRSDNPPLYLN